METTAIATDISADLDLEAEVIRALRSLDILRPTRAKVNVSVARGFVTLTGSVPSIFVAKEVERAVREVPGVTGVSNQLVDDGTLTRRIALDLATDSRTRGIPLSYQVTSFFGHVGVVGNFTGEQTRAVTEVCQSIDGVRSVKVVPTR